MAFNQKPRGGRRWFAVESKSFELLIDEVGGKLRGCIWERCKGITSWIRFGDASLSSLLGLAVEVEMIEVGLSFGTRKEGSIGWSVVQMRREDFSFEKLREVGVAPFGGLKDPLSFEVLKKEKDLEPRTFVDVAKWKMGRLGDKLLKGKLDIAVLGSGLLLFDFELLSEAERVLARGKRRVLGSVLFLEKWHSEVGCFCNGAFSNEAWVRVLGLPLHLWNREVFKLIGDGCGGFIVVDDKMDSMTELQWARLLVKMVGRDLPTSVQIGWAGSLLGKGAIVDEVETGSGSRVVCRGSVLEKDVQPKEQAGVQVEPSCGSSSKGATCFSSESAERGPGVEAIDGEDSLGNRSQDAGKVERPFYIKGCLWVVRVWPNGFRAGLGGIKGVRAHSHAEVRDMEVRATKEASRVQVREDVGVACFLRGDWRDSEAFSVKARALMTNEVLTAEASRYESFLTVFGGDQVFFSSSPSSGCDRALVVGGVSGTEDTVEGVGFRLRCALC
ncbi:hypothetical protein CK203_017277 [Vitis vinifera]|uniref:DUF4283 domain-containing protein n=1 Tax=Vitis vinifera TaxID=29760 RepID=A0A438JZA7_VITVI|nr:hypothetical protein CK203_017277 [Vitis vinifera]